MNENVQKKLVEPLRHVPTQTDKRRTKIDFSICGLTQTDRNEYKLCLKCVSPLEMLLALVINLL
jgi:hypothetical protein